LGDASSLGLNDSSTFVGYDLCCVEENSLPCSELELCSWEEPNLCEPLSCCPPGANVNPDCTGTTTSGWVLQKVKDLRHYVGLSCVGFEEWASNSKPTNKGKRELKRLLCYISIMILKMAVLANAKLR
jgi:hypothetical protein